MTQEFMEAYAQMISAADRMRNIFLNGPSSADVDSAREVPARIPVGALLRGYCFGYVPNDGYGDKTVEAVGADWIVVREGDEAKFASDPAIHRILSKLRVR